MNLLIPTLQASHPSKRLKVSKAKLTHSALELCFQPLPPWAGHGGSSALPTFRDRQAPSALKSILGYGTFHHGLNLRRCGQALLRSCAASALCDLPLRSFPAKSWTVLRVPGVRLLFRFHTGLGWVAFQGTIPVLFSFTKDFNPREPNQPATDCECALCCWMLKETHKLSTCSINC